MSEDSASPNASARERIATAAARLVMADGLAAATADRIAAEADVARRPSSAISRSKGSRSPGITAIWIAAITDAVRRQPRTFRHGALAAACQELAVGSRASPIRSPTSNGRPANR